MSESSDFPPFTRRDCILAITRFIATFLIAALVFLATLGAALRLFYPGHIHRGALTPTALILSEPPLLFASALATTISIPRAWRSRSTAVRIAHLAPISSRRFVEGATTGLCSIIVVTGLIVLCGGATLSAPAPSWCTLALYLPAFLLVALSEEILMRGALLSWLERLWGFPTAAIITSCAFGALHIANGEPWAGIASAALFGLFFCLTLRVTGTLWFAIGFHTLWDYGQSALFGARDSGLSSTGALINMRISGSDWISGGQAGPEGSAICIALIAGACCWLIRRIRAADDQSVPIILARTPALLRIQERSRPSDDP